MLTRAQRDAARQAERERTYRESFGGRPASRQVERCSARALVDRERPGMTPAQHAQRLPVSSRVIARKNPPKRK